MQRRVFLKAEWRKLMMANYVIDPGILKHLLPPHTEIDLFNGKCYVSLVGFMFIDTRIKGIRVPYHINFEEVNLRFYVRHQTPEGGWRRGVCFVKEIVPRPAITLIANTLYNEKYQTMRMRHSIHMAEELEVTYEWKYRGRWNSMSCRADKKARAIDAGSEHEFITEHYWGYTKTGEAKSAEYEVSHPRWHVYDVKDYTIDVDFGTLYGPAFAQLEGAAPGSVLLAEGSEVLIRHGRRC